MTETEALTIKSVMENLHSSLQQKTRDNGEKFYCFIDDSPQYMTDIIHEVHGEKLPDDTTYSFIYEALEKFNQQDLDDTGIETLRECISELEPDIYNSELTGWLHARNDHLEYLSSELMESNYNDAFGLLQCAQLRHKCEVAEDLLSAIASVIDNQDSE